MGDGLKGPGGPFARVGVDGLKGRRPFARGAGERSAGAQKPGGFFAHGLAPYEIKRGSSRLRASTTRELLRLISHCSLLT